MAKKLIIINGHDSPLNNNKDKNYIYSKNLLEKYIEVIEIGDDKGFLINKLPELLRDKIEDNAEIINIIVNMHSNDMHGKIPEKYELLSCINDKGQPIFIEIENFFQFLTEATNNIKLNILFLSCFGANIIDNIENFKNYLPIGSKIITFSDKDKPSQLVEDQYENPNIFESITEGIFNEGFKIEYLLQLHCFNQKIHNNTPSVLSVTDKGIKKLDFESLKEEYIKSPFLYSAFIEKMFKQNIFNKTDFDYVADKLKNHTVEQLKPPHNLNNLFLKHYEEGTLENLKQEWIEQYYFKNHFEHLDFILKEDVHYLSSDDTPFMFFEPCTGENELVSETDKIMPQHSIAMGLVIDYAINNGEL